MMKIAVTGANGLLGQYLVKHLLEEGYVVLATGRGPSRLPFKNSGTFSYHHADLTDKPAIRQMLIAERPDVLVHAGAMTQLDECEQHREECVEINVHATAHLLELAEVYSRFFIFISSDFVFDGKNGNYIEDDALGPVSWYGTSKQRAEQIVQSGKLPWAIVRTCLVYGNALSGSRSNMITWVKASLEDGKAIKVVGDQVRTPTYVEDLAKGIALIIHKKAAGIFHISGKDVLTPYQMAMATADYLHLKTDLISKVDASVFTQPATRPPLTGFNITKARDQLGFEPISFDEGLQRMFGYTH